MIAAITTEALTGSETSFMAKIHDAKKHKGQKIIAKVNMIIKFVNEA